MTMPASMGRKAGYECNFVTRPKLYRLITGPDGNDADSGVAFAAISSITVDSVRIGRQQLVLDFLANPNGTHEGWESARPKLLGKFGLFYDMSGANTDANSGTALTTSLNHYHQLVLDGVASDKSVSYPAYWNLVLTSNVYNDNTHHVISDIFPGTYKVLWLSDLELSYNRLAILWSSLE